MYTTPFSNTQDHWSMCYVHVLYTKDTYIYCYLGCKDFHFVPLSKTLSLDSAHENNVRSLKIRWIAMWGYHFVSFVFLCSTVPILQVTPCHLTNVVVVRMHTTHMNVQYMYILNSNYAIRSIVGPKCLYEVHNSLGSSNGYWHFIIYLPDRKLHFLML